MLGPAVDASPDELRRALHTALVDQDERQFFTVSRSNCLPAERSVKFGSQGHVLLNSREPEAQVGTQMGALTAAAIPWATLVDHAYLTGDDWDAEQNKMARPGLRRAAYSTHQRDRDQERLPEAFAWQIVTSRHLDAARDLSTWRIDEVGEDRYTLAHPDPWAWFLPDPEHEEASLVDPEVLVQARADFGKIILSEVS